MTATTAKSRARRANQKAARAVANPWLQRGARLGYVVRGILYALMGGLALEYAFGSAVATTDQRGSLVLLGGMPLRTIVLSVAVAGLAAYSIWGFTRAIFDPLKRGSDPTGIAARLGFAWSGLNYAALALFATTFALHRAGPGADPVQKAVLTMLSAPAGRAMTVIAGAIGVVAGLGQFFDAYKATFRKDFKRTRMNRAERLAADNLGRFGMFSRGVIFTMLGWFIVLAGLTRDPSRAEGMGTTFQTLGTQPLGRYLLVVVATGFIALGIHSVLAARWMRMPEPRPGKD
jgi:hypothetical protein